MTSRHIRLPSMRCLRAFESAARLSSFTAAATELHTSQSSISRHIADLEKILGGQLFRREKQRVHLSDKGEYMYRSVTHGLDSICSGMQVVAGWVSPSQVTIACTHAVSHLLVMPMYEALSTAMGEQAQVRIMTYEYEILDSALNSQIDLVFEYAEGVIREPDRVRVLQEAVRPMCSPDFMRQHHAVLDAGIDEWQALPILDMATPNRGWATWDNWFEYQGVDAVARNVIHFENYVYLLEAAAAGRGIALGARGLIENYLDNGRLLPLHSDYVEFDRALYALLTERGRGSKPARRCLTELGDLAQART